MDDALVPGRLSVPSLSAVTCTETVIESDVVDCDSDTVGAPTPWACSSRERPSLEPPATRGSSNSVSGVAVRVFASLAPMG